MNNELTKIQLYDETSRKVSYIDSVNALIHAADGADDGAALYCTCLMAQLSKEIERLAAKLLFAKE